MAEFNLKNKVAVITGGAQGIGFNIAEEFLKKDARTIILLDIGIEKGDQAANKLNSKYGAQKAIFIKCDVTKDLDKISELIFEKYQKIDVLVNNAGVVKEDSVRTTMEINAIAVMEWTLKFQEHMAKEKDGTIINISSVYGFRVDQFLPLYKASKFAIMGFSRSLGHVLNYQSSRVRIIVLCPGFTRTNMIKETSGIKHNKEGLIGMAQTMGVQDVDVVGKAAVDVYETAKSGTAWLVEDIKLTEII